MISERPIAVCQPKVHNERVRHHAVPHFAYLPHNTTYQVYWLLNKKTYWCDTHQISSLLKK